MTSRSEARSDEPIRARSDEPIRPAPVPFVLGQDMRYVRSLASLGRADLAIAGGKNASLGEMLRHLGNAGVQVPDGFALTAEAFRAHLDQAGLTAWIESILAPVDVGDVERLATIGREIRDRIRASPLPDEIAAELQAAYRQLSNGQDDLDVAVRSSATAEDLPDASFAGQHDTFLNVRGPTALADAVRACMASLYNDRAIVYRAERGFRHTQVAISVGVQRMVRSDLGSAGVIFTLDTETGFQNVILLTGAWGLAETVVQGRVRPDEYWVHKSTLRSGFRPLLRSEIGDKRVKLVYGKTPSVAAVEEVPVEAERRTEPVLGADEVLELARWALVIEEHYQVPMDIEWAKDGRSGELFIVQARPETVHARTAGEALELYQLDRKGTVILTGKSVGTKVATGRVRTIRSVADLPSFMAGDILVSRMTDPSWEPVLKRAAAVITDEGGRTCHAAIVSRELGIPCVVGTGRATEVLADGQPVTVACSGGDQGIVYDGILPFHVETIDASTLPARRVPILLNVADPDRAFALAMTPNDGVGLLRIEFVISRWVGVHPMALRFPERVADEATRQEIARITARSPDPARYFVDRLASGIAVIAAAFHPKPVIVRFSDFKTNEYADLLGGRGFEPAEENPMLGFRGAARYYDERYRAAFALECEAIRVVREVMGLTNVKVMIPFCRTLGEATRVLAEIASNGLHRGEDGLEVYVMCEIPSNALLAADFGRLFDGFSIGSNDLTQLTLGVDRDSALLAPLFDERDPAVKAMIEMVIREAHRVGRPVGICGQAPSDYPDFARWLVEIGIDSISLNPDSVVAVIRELARPGPGAEIAGTQFGGGGVSTLATK
jgi:pyruvate,water dikinase